MSDSDYSDDSNSSNGGGNRFAGLLDSDSDDYESEPEVKKATNQFAALLDSSDEYQPQEEEENEENKESQDNPPKEQKPEIPITTFAPPPPSSSSNQQQSKKKKKEIDIDAEFLELEQAQSAKAAANPQKTTQQRQSRNFCPQFNIGKELYDRFQDQTFSEYFHLPKKAHPSRFIHRVKNWPHSIPSYFSVKELKNHNFELSFTEYAKTLEKSHHGQYAPTNDLFYYGTLIYMMLYYTTQREFTKATESALMLTYVLQQAIPTNFIFGKSKFIPKDGSETMLETILKFLGMYAFRRGCYTTAYSLHRFLFESLPDSYEGKHILYSLAGTSLYAGDYDFIKACYEDKSITIDGISLDKFPEWRVCYAIACNDDKLITKEMGLWKHIFTGESTPEQDCDSLTRLQLCAGKRLSQFLGEKPLSERLKSLRKNIVEEDRSIFQKTWKDVKFEEPHMIEMWVEEYVFPIAS